MFSRVRWMWGFSSQMVMWTSESNFLLENVSQSVRKGVREAKASINMTIWWRRLQDYLLFLWGGTPEMINKLQNKLTEFQSCILQGMLKPSWDNNMKWKVRAKGQLLRWENQEVGPEGRVQGNEIFTRLVWATSSSLSFQLFILSRV